MVIALAVMISLIWMVIIILDNFSYPKHYTWRRVGGLAILSGETFPSEDVPYSKMSLRKAIATVKSHKQALTTDKAYQAALQKFEEGLRLFK